MIRILPIAILLATAPMAVSAMAKDKPSSEKSEDDKKICKRETATGSIMSRATCRTKAEWDAIAAQSKADRELARDAVRSRSLVNETR